MGKANKRIKQYADIMVGKAMMKNKYECNMPPLFDGTIDQYIGWLKYLKKIAKINNIDILIHLDGRLKL